MGTLTYTDELQILECGGCHITFAMPVALYKQRLNDHKTWWCPNGCSRHYTGPTEEAKLRAKLDQAQADARWQREQKERVREQLAAAERSRTALKGHLTRWRKRVANGVCPVEGCKRHFPDLQAHVATKHPGWLEAHPEVFDG